MSDDQNVERAPFLSGRYRPAAVDEINVGAAGEELRYWRAKEAVRQAELALNSQADARRGFDARVTAMLGWIVAAGSLLVAGLANSPSRWPIMVVALIPLFVGAIVCIAMVWPSWWGHAGYEPRALLDSDLGSELEELESMAQGYSGVIDHNDRWLRRASRLMGLVYVLAAIAPVAAAVTFFRA